MSSFTTSSSRWKAITTRDSAASDAFIYSVTTTKIYCRPDCPSRLARRANIVYHDTAVQAEAAGFRPCLRCRPSEAIKDDPQKVAIGKACALVEAERNGQIWSVRNLGKEVGLTESHFCRTFKRIVGCTVGQYRAMVNVMPLPESTGTDASWDSLELLDFELGDDVWASFVDFGPTEMLER